MSREENHNETINSVLFEYKVEQILAEVEQYKKEIFADKPEENTIAAINQQYKDILQQLDRLNAEINSLQKNAHPIKRKAEEIKDNILTSLVKLLTSLDKTVEKLKTR